MYHEQYMQKAVKEALLNIRENRGGPFAAVVVKDGKIIAVGTNEVTTANDPTAHAEVQAIRKACQKLGTFQLTDCVLYTSCEPCPMCLGAIYWARFKEVYYCFTRDEAAHIGFDDAFIYNELPLVPHARTIPAKHFTLDLSSDENPFMQWQNKHDKIKY
ncbi:nucleoside deaminase [Ectobacillus panaciterrae]|uniref:nucleoside deaminase n=1 Tax=Ectobacillus panaciterrae TaxID=363872 RepID=UPI0003F5F7D4|nr:nucleoside deaminase [Ectobacillus panaciterrae]